MKNTETILMLVTFDLGVFVNPLVVQLSRLFQTFTDHSFNFLWRNRGDDVLHQHLQAQGSSVMPRAFMLQSSCGRTLQTLSSRDSVAFRAPSGRPKGKQYLQGTEKSNVGNQADVPA